MVRSGLSHLAAAPVNDAVTDVAAPIAFDSHAAREALVDAALRLARRRIVVFTDSLGAQWDEAGRVNTLKSFCLASPRNALHVVLRDAQSFQRYCPRLQQLALTFGHIMAIRRPRQETALPRDNWLVVDDTHFVHQFHVDHPRGTAGSHLPAATEPLCARFSALWTDSDPVRTGRPLGL
jgi:hypothetical protein